MKNINYLFVVYNKWTDTISFVYCTIKRFFIRMNSCEIIHSTYGIMNTRDGYSIWISPFWGITYSLDRYMCISKESFFFLVRAKKRHTPFFRFACTQSRIHYETHMEPPLSHIHLLKRRPNFRGTRRRPSSALA